VEAKIISRTSLLIDAYNHEYVIAGEYKLFTRRIVYFEKMRTTIAEVV